MQQRTEAAEEIARSGGQLALDYFKRLPSLTIEDKGPQDFVTEADKSVEAHIRGLIAAAFPDDGIVGEEDAPKPSGSGVTWVIDPIDGTANFISGIPQWCVILAVVQDDQIQIGVTYDAVHDELFSATRGQGATLNGSAMMCSQTGRMDRGSVGTGFSNRTSPEASLQVMGDILADGGRFFRNASGGLSLAYVAAGRLVGYIEQHMHAWDCLAGQLLIEEAGGRIEQQSATQVIDRGGRVVAGSAGVFDRLQRIADNAYGPED